MTQTTDLEQRLREYRPTNEWGDGVHHVICDEAADEIARLRAENEALKRELASRPQWAGGQSPITCGSGGVGFRAVQPTSEGHAAVLADLARRIDDE